MDTKKKMTTQEFDAWLLSEALSLPTPMNAYTSSQAISSRGTQLLYQTSASIGYLLVSEVKQCDFTGQKLDLADVTNYQGGQFKEYLATLLDSGEVSAKANFIPSDTSQAAVLGFFNNATLVAWKVVLPTNVSTSLPYGHFTFNAYVAGFEYGLPIDKEAVLTIKLKVTGAITYVAGS